VSSSAPVRVRLRYADLDTFVERFAPNVTRGGVFIASRAPRPVGDQFPFEIQLASGQVALAGEGKVIWVKEYDPAQPTKSHGMGVQFLSLSVGSRELVARMLKIKGTQRGPGAPRGLTQPLAPLAGGYAPNGGAAARRRVDTNVDLAAEFGLDELALRRAVDRAWLPGGRSADDDLQALLTPDAAEPATLGQALGELRRMLDPTARRRTGAFRTLEALTPLDKAPVPAAEPVAATPSTENGVGSRALPDLHDQHDDQG
jgi:uncharacterized protein (TIGR02266 family)